MNANIALSAALSCPLADAAKWAFTTRRVNRAAVCGLSTAFETARAGDLVLGRVEQLGSHKNIQLVTGRPSALYPGDAVVLACGARYAADQFEGFAEIDPDGADMLAGGGVLGRMREKNGRMAAPTRITPLGMLTGADGRAINLDRFALPRALRPRGMPVIGLIGAGMNSGKTDAAASLAHGLARAGLRVAAIKGTGTGAFGDMNAYADAGAQVTLDFTDAGMATTYLEPLPRIRAALDTLLAEAAARDCDVAVVEIADGVLQRETAALLADPAARSAFDGFLYACPDALSAVGGVAALAPCGVRPHALTGLISRAPLATREAEAATGLRVISREALRDPAEAMAALRMIAARSSATVQG